MTRPFSATAGREGERYIAQDLEVEVASQGDTEEEGWNCTSNHRCEPPG
ncbi:MAG TPA: hypothetical protein VHZ25_07380 [Acidobacteriaceae bacterium]|nr:hypothetical protein [Acidobacteriaceae bacterium]